MIDIHTHILPGVDDGCQTLAEARKMLEMEYENGVDTVILTPHFDLSKDRGILLDSFAKFREQVKDIPVRLVLGAEILWKPGTLDALKRGELFTLGDSSWVLIEFDFVDWNYHIADTLFDFVCCGYQVILAHPERYLYLSVEDLREIKSRGVFLQVNTSSLLGDFGRTVKKRAKKLAASGMIDFIASDCHSTGTRSPNLTEEFRRYIRHKEPVLL